MDANPDFRVELIDVQDTYGLRTNVLTTPKPRSIYFVEDEIEGTFHLGVKDMTGKIVSVASFVPQELEGHRAQNAYRLRGMATDSGFQSKGLGTLLMHAALSELDHRGCTLLWANARDAAIPFYQRLGMSVDGEGFEFSGLPHHLVTRELG